MKEPAADAIRKGPVRALQHEQSPERLVFKRSVDLRFVGQGSETNIPLAAGDFAAIERAEIRRLFDAEYERLYGRTYPASPVEFVNFRLRASLPERPLELPRLAKTGGDPLSAVKGERRAFCAIAHDFVPHTVYDRYRLCAGAAFDGPAIIEERESTVVVGSERRVTLDEFGFLWIDLQGASR